MEDYLNLSFKTVLQSKIAAYTILQRLGVGGSAETYLVVSPQGNLRGQLFAVKVFRRLSKPNWMENFNDQGEYRTTNASAISHPRSR